MKATNTADSPRRNTVVIDVGAEPSGGRHGSLRELWSYREVFVVLVWRDVKIRYKETWIGLGWAILQPALMALVFQLFLAPVATRSGELTVPYTLYVYSGFLVWTFFSTALVNASNSVIASEAIITKTYFPRLLLPWAAVGASLADLVVASAGLAVLIVYLAVEISWQLLLFPICVIPVVLAAGGVGSLFAALNVRYRDFRYLIPFLVQLWMFATPILFLPASALPFGSAPGSRGSLSVQSVLGVANPMNGLVDFFRAAALNAPLHWQQFAVSFLAVAFLVAAGSIYFHRVEKDLADII